MMKMLLAAVTLALSGTGVAQAAETVFTTRAGFNAATTGQAVDTFGTAATQFVGGAPYVRTGYQMSVNDGYMFNINPVGDTQYYYNWGSGNVMFIKQSGAVTFTFNAPTTAFAIDLGTFWQNFPAPTSYSFSVGVATPGSELNVVTGPNQTLTFFGLTSTTAFNSITIYGGANNFTVFDNVTLATANATSAVPEPATWLMMILGFGMIGAGIRSRRTSVAFAA